jgi:hypothetical protein
MVDDRLRARTKVYERFGRMQATRLRADGGSIANPVLNLELAAVVEHEAH